MKHIWDEDIKWARVVLWGMVSGNAIATGGMLWRHQWFNAAAGFVWLCNMLVMLKLARCLQETRDRVRIVTAANEAIREELDKR